ncbi:MAG: RICIN domain-containing protein, partial [Candidatus Fimimonas sp.]
KACNATKQSGASNQVEYTVEEPEPEPTQLATPENVQIVGNRITWNAVENAAGYEVYVNGTRATTVATTEYVCVERETGSYEITIVSVNSPNYLASEPSASVNYTVEEFDISKPVLATTEYKNVVYCAQICEDGYLRIQPMSEITDFTKYMWYLEPDGTGMYNIKLWNGLYLGYSDVGASDASETIQTALNGTHTQWKVVNTSSNNYKLFNVAHAERWDSSFTWCYFYGVKTNDAGTHDVLKFGDNCSTWVFGNLDIPFVEPQILDAPVVSLSGATASWPAVEHATAYEVYVEDEKVSTQQETSYTATACGKIRVVAIDETHEYLSSVLSNTVYFVDYSSPVALYETSHNNLLTINGDGLLVEGVSKNESLADYSAYAMQLIAVGDYYKIKLANGMYLQHTKIADTDRFVAAYAADVDSQLFKIVAREDGNFNLYPKDNEGYVICTDNKGGYNQYNDANYGGAIFVFVNVQATIAEDAQQPIEETFSFQLPVYPVYKTNNDELLTIGIASDGIITMVAVADVTDFSQHMMYLEKVEDTEYYKIKLYNGKYLTRVDGGGSGPEAAAMALITSGDTTTQQWKFVASEGGYKMQNLSHINQWGDYYYGEWYGVFKFGACNPWILENKDIPFVEPEEPTLDLSKPIVMYETSHNNLLTINGDGLLVEGVSKNESLADYSAYAM